MMHSTQSLITQHQGVIPHGNISTIRWYIFVTIQIARGGRYLNTASTQPGTCGHYLNMPSTQTGTGGFVIYTRTITQTGTGVGYITTVFVTDQGHGGRYLNTPWT